MSWRIALTLLILAPSPAMPDSSLDGNVSRHGRLAACPDSPNCVSSDAGDPAHRVPPFKINLPAKEAWRLAKEAVKDIPRTTITEVTDVILHAECRSLVFRFVDDLELELRADKGIIAVRSASRKGHSDFGVNRRRVEDLRERLRSRGVVR